MGVARRCELNMTNFAYSVLAWLIRRIRQIAATALICLGVVFLYSAILGEWDPNWMQLVRNTRDPEIQKALAETDKRTVQAFGIVFKTYEKNYGKEAWAGKYAQDNRGGYIKYLDIAKLAVGLSVVDGRDRFLAEHAATYDACVRAGLMEIADGYAGLLTEVHEKGGLGWRVVAKNAFSLCVYSELRDEADLWNWYLEEYNWCDKYLSGCSPEEGVAIKDVLTFLRAHADIMRAFNHEIDSLDEESAKEIEREDPNLSGLRMACLAFAEENAALLEEVRKLQSKIALLDVMSVIANNSDVGITAEELVLIHDRKQMLWNFAAGEKGQGVIRLNRDVPQWSEKIVARYGKMDGITFLYEFYNDTPGLLAVAAEILCRCDDPGWVVLQKFRRHGQFKEIMQNPKVGFRIVPYYFRQGDEVFTKLAEDPRWIDELLDKDGNLKRQDVSWYEISDLATVIKKMAQNRPISGAEVGWAAFEVADLAAMAFTGGASKAVSSAGKGAVKSGAKFVGKTAAKQLAEKSARRLGCNMAERGALAMSAKQAKRTMLKRFSTFFSSAAQTVSAPVRKVGEAVKANRKVVHNCAKALLVTKFVVHTIPDKGPDFVRSTMEKVGDASGKYIRALIEGAGDGFTAAVREVLGIDSRQTDARRIGYALIGLVVFMGGVLLLRKKKG